MNPDELRREADIEAAQLKAERMKTADKIPTCPECGGRSFKIGAWTVVTQSIDFAEDEDGEWSDDYESGDHGETNESAECNECGANVRAMLEAHGWTFYAEPAPDSKGGE